VILRSLDGAGWVAGIRKDLSAESNEKNDVISDDKDDILVR